MVMMMMMMMVIVKCLSFRQPIHISNNYGPIMKIRIGKPSVELSFRMNFTRDRTSIGVEMSERSQTYDDYSQPHYDLNSQEMLLGTELFRTGSYLTRMALQVNPYLARTSEFDGIIGAGRRSEFWSKQSEVSLTSSVFVFNGLHESLTTLGRVDGPPIECSRNIEDYAHSDALCIATARVLGKLYHVEILSSYVEPIVLPTELYDELFYHRRWQKQQKLPTIELKFEDLNSAEQEPNKNKKNIVDHRRRLCVKRYKEIGIHIPNHGCKNTETYVMRIDPSDYIFESNEQTTSKNRRHKEFRVREQPVVEEEEEEEEEDDDSKKRLSSHHNHHHGGLKTISLGTGLLNSFVFHFNFDHHKLIVLNRNSLLHVTDFHLFLIVLLALLFVRWTLTNNVLNSCWYNTPREEILMNFILELLGMSVILVSYASSRVFDLLDFDPFIFYAVTIVVLSLLVLEFLTMLCQFFTVIYSEIPHRDLLFQHIEFYATSYRRIAYTQAIFYAIWLLTLDIMCESFSNVTSFLLFFVQLYMLLTNLFIIRKLLWWTHNIHNIRWIILVIFFFLYLVWSLYFISVRHFNPLYRDFFNQHTGFAPFFTIGTVLFITIFASETSNYFIPVLI